MPGDRVQSSDASKQGILFAYDDSPPDTTLSGLASAENLTCISLSALSSQDGPLGSVGRFSAIILDVRQLSSRRNAWIFASSSPLRILKNDRPTIPILLLVFPSDTQLALSLRGHSIDDFVVKPPETDLDFYRRTVFPIIHHLRSRFASCEADGLLRHLRSLDEKRFRSAVLIPLLHALGFPNARSTPHDGPGEQGFDILPFYKIDEFGCRFYYAAQTKAGDIHAKSSARGHVNEAINQIQSALIIPFLDEDNSQRTIDKMLLICSGSVTPDARAVIQERLHRDHRLAVIDGAQVLALLIKNNLTHVIHDALDPYNMSLLAYSWDRDTDALTWEEILRQAVTFAVAEDRNMARTIHEAILHSETQFLPTYIGNRCAMPHYHHTGLPHQVVLLLHTKADLPWVSAGGPPVRFALCYLTAYSERGKRCAELRRILLPWISKVAEKGATEIGNPFVDLDAMSADLAKALDAGGFAVTAKERVWMEGTRQAASQCEGPDAM